jgi:hypothetical protein
MAKKKSFLSMIVDLPKESVKSGAKKLGKRSKRRKRNRR